MIIGSPATINLTAFPSDDSYNSLHPYPTLLLSTLRLLVSPFLNAGILQLWASITAIFTFGMFLANEFAVWQLGKITAGTAAKDRTMGWHWQPLMALHEGGVFGGHAAPNDLLCMMTEHSGRMLVLQLIRTCYSLHSDTRSTVPVDGDLSGDHLGQYREHCHHSSRLRACLRLHRCVT